MRRRPVLALSSLLLLSTPLVVACGCSGSTSAAQRDSGAADTGRSADAGKDSGLGVPHEPFDAGRDAAKEPDAGHARDAGHAPDSGHTPDAAHAGDAGDAATDARSTADSGFVAGMPITATDGQWTWVPFDGAFCANGTTTGIGVNLSTTSSRVLIYMEAGGACWSDLTCYTLQTATYITGYGPSDFEAESTDETYLAAPGGFFDRTSSTNPFKDYSYVYVPYCTGDAFAGSNVTTLGTTPTHFVGYQNVGAYLERIVPTFPSADRVILAGSSAGGFGALVNWERTQQAFGAIRVDMIDDSGTAVPDDVDEAGASQIAQQGAAWNIQAAIPAGCTTCLADQSTIYGYYDTLFASHRGALLSYTDDSVLPDYFGISETAFTTGLDQDLSRYFTASDPLKSFVVNASGHVLWFTPQLMTSTDVTVLQFVTEMVTDDAAWTDEGP